jgi:O-antigen/teichoic acid export membrane protein
MVIFRDTVYLLVGQTALVGSSYAVHILVARSLGPAEYGLFGVVLSVLAVFEVFLARGVRDTVTKYVSEYPDRAGTVFKKGLALESALAAASFAVFLALAPPLSALFHDPRLLTPLRIAALAIPVMALFSIDTGYLTGACLFAKTSLSMGAHGLVKVAAVAAIVLLGGGINGAIAGYILAYLAGIAVATWYLSQADRPVGPFPMSRMIRFSTPLILFAAGTTLLLNLDILFVKALIRSAAAVGYYTSASSLTKAPYSVLFAFSLTLLPAVSKSSAAGDAAGTSLHVRQSLRFLLLLLTPLCFLMCGLAGPIIRIVYSDAFRPAAGPLRILIFGIGFISLFYNLSSAITGRGRPKAALAIVAGALPLAVVLHLYLIPRFGLAGAALATTIACGAAFAASAVVLAKTVGPILEIGTVLRILLAASLILPAGILWPGRGWLTVPYALALGVVYLLILRLLGEIKSDDWDLVRDVWARLRTRPIR